MRYTKPDGGVVRYVIAAVNEERYVWVVKELPDANHVHLARQTDGTVTATPMRHPAFYEEEHFVVPLWVDEVSS